MSREEPDAQLPKPELRRFRDRGEQERAYTFLLNLSGCPSELERRIAKILGWTAVREDYATEGNLSSMRVLGIPPGDDTEGLMPRYASLHDPIERDLIPLLFDRDNPGGDSEEKARRYMAWLKESSGEWALAFAYPHLRCAAFILTMEGYEPIPEAPDAR